jgi:hypothetical protein
LEPILHFSTWTWSNLALSAPWSLPLTSPHQLHNLHWTWFELNNPNHAMPWHGMPLHAISSPGHFQRATPCQISPSHSPDAAQPLPRRSQAPETSAHARPGTPRTRPCRARARMALTLDAQSVTKPRAPASPPHSLSTPVDARRHTAPPGHGHLPAGTPQTTTASTPSRHDLQASRQAHRRCSASFSSQSSASAPHGRRQHSAPITWLFAALDRRRPWRT